MYQGPGAGPVATCIIAMLKPGMHVGSDDLGGAQTGKLSV